MAQVQLLKAHDHGEKSHRKGSIIDVMEHHVIEWLVREGIGRVVDLVEELTEDKPAKKSKPLLTTEQDVG
jgi:hypothetical protein